MGSPPSGPWPLVFWATLALGAGPAWGEDLGGLLPTSGELAPLQLVGAVEEYSPERLWERINGEAELYRQYGLTAAAIAYFEDPREAERGLEISVFRLSDPLGAYGLFAAFRGPGEEVLEVGNAGVVEAHQGLFWQGQWFVLLQAFGSDATRGTDLRRAAAAVGAALGAPPPAPEILTRFFAQVRPESVRFHPDHLFGRAALPPGLSGTAVGGATLFVATVACEDPAAMAGYAATLERAAPLRVGEREGFRGRDPALGPIAAVDHAGRWIGVRGRVSEEDLGGLLQGLAAVAGAR